MKRDSEHINKLVHQELKKIKNAVVKEGISLLLLSEPIPHLRKWEYGEEDEKFECWTIAVDSKTETAIVFSDYGHQGWGLVSTINLEFGMDCGWFNNLMECYLNSFAASELSIWSVMKETENGNKVRLTNKMKMDVAFNERDRFADVDVNGSYHVDYILD